MIEAKIVKLYNEQYLCLIDTGQEWYYSFDSTPQCLFRAILNKFVIQYLEYNGKHSADQVKCYLMATAILANVEAKEKPKDMKISSLIKELDKYGDIVTIVWEYEDELI